MKVKETQMVVFTKCNSKAPVSEPVSQLTKNNGFSCNFLIALFPLHQFLGYHVWPMSDAVSSE